MDSAPRDREAAECPGSYVRAEKLAESFLQGVSIEELARAYGLSIEEVEEAVRLVLAGAGRQEG